MKKTIYTFIITNYLTVAAILIAQAQDGSLDLTFGTGGKVTTSIGGFRDSGYSIVIQSDGKIVVAGSSNDSSGNDFAVVRYNSDGTLDTTFDSDGKVTTAIGSSDDYGGSIAMQNDGKILVAGNSDRGNGFDFALVRYNTDGTLDNTFDSDGILITNFGTCCSSGNSVAFQSDGKIVVAGSTYNGSNEYFALARYNSDGTLDNSFDSDGKVTTAIGNQDDNAVSIAIQNDGKIVVAGYSANGSNYDFALVRYNSDGTLDNDFDTDGKVTTDLNGPIDVGHSVTIQSDGKLIVAGNSGTGSGNDFALVRYNSDGSLDNSFGSGGKVIAGFDILDDVGNSVVIQSDGKIVVAGYLGNILNADFALIRYTTDGSLDQTFGSDGKVTTDFGNDVDDLHSVTIQSDGKIVVAGESFNHHGISSFAVARYNSTLVGIVQNSADENTLTLSPNPFNNEIFINGTKENDEILILDEMGNELIREKTIDTVTKINTEKLLPGFYFLNYTDGNKSSITKMVKF